MPTDSNAPDNTCQAACRGAGWSPMNRVTSRLTCKLLLLRSSLMCMLILSPEAAVQHFDIPGSIPNTRTGEGEAVVLDLFVKVVQEAASRQYRGVAFFASVDATRYHTWGGDLSMPPAVVGWDVPIYLKSVTTGAVYNTTVRDNHPHREHEQKGETRLAMPVRLYGELPDADDYYELHVADWDRFVYVSACEPDTFQQGVAPEIWIVLPPVTGLRNLHAATLLLHNVRYHVALGFNVTAYVLLPQLKDFREHPDLQPYISSKQLELVLWDEISQCQHFQSCQHTMQSSHAALAAWGKRRLTLLIDLDEYVALPPSLTVMSFVDTCFAGNATAVLPRYDIGCKQCTDEPAIWLAASKVFDRDAPHPLQLYDVLGTAYGKDNGKAILNPDDVLGVAIHGGHRLRGSMTHLSKNCGRILHVPNMFRQRTNAGGLPLSPEILHWPPGLRSL